MTNSDDKTVSERLQRQNDQVQRMTNSDVPKQALDGRVLGVLTGQVPVDSMPIATSRPCSELCEGDDHVCGEDRVPKRTSG